MSEKVNDPFAAYENHGVLKPVAQVASAIALALGREGISTLSNVYQERSVIITIDDGYQVTESLMNELVTQYDTAGVEIGFNEVEQIILVRPTEH